MDLIEQKGGEYLEEVSLFDVYKGEQVADSMKSVAFALSFRAQERTLTDEDVNIAMERILKNLEKPSMLSFVHETVRQGTFLCLKGD